MNKTAFYATGYFAYAQYDISSFCKLFVVEAAPKRNKQGPQRLLAFAHSDGGKALRSKCGRIKSLTRLRNRSFFVETLRSIATFRVSEEKFLISFWQRFFFLWLRFFLFGRSKKKEMNKTAFYATGYFAYAQYDVLKYRHSANCLALRQRRNGTNRVLKDSSLTLNMTPRHHVGRRRRTLSTGYFASFRANGKPSQGRRLPRKIKFRYNLTTFFQKRGIFFLQRLIINIRTNL